MSHEQFEAQVRAADQASLPRLARANYTATLGEGGLTGTAEWSFAVVKPGLFTLEPFRFAIRNPRRTNGEPVPIFRGEPPGRPLATYLWIDRAGDTTVLLDWSARGIEEPTAERFELAFPSAELMSLELDLPSDRVPLVASPDVLVTGPIPKPNSRATWRLGFAGQTRFDLVVRRSGESAPVVRTDRRTRYDLTVGSVGCVVEFEVETIRGMTNEVVIEIESGFQVTEISGPGRLAWRKEPGPFEVGTNRLRVSALDPGVLSRIVVSGQLSPIETPGPWSGPAAWIVEALPGEDRVEYRIDNELKFEGLDPGDYRIVSAGSMDRGYQIALAGDRFARVDARARRRTPVLRLQPAPVEVSTREETSWKVSLDRSELSLRSQVRVNRGPLTRVLIEQPSGFTVESVALTPDDPGATWGPISGSPGRLAIEPSRAVFGGQSITVRVVFRGPGLGNSPDSENILRLPFPRMGLIGAVERDGVFTVEVSSSTRVWPNPIPPEYVPAHEATRSFVYPFRGQPPIGELVALPIAERLMSRSQIAITDENAILSALATIVIRPIAGEITSLTLFIPETHGFTWQLRAEGAVVGELVNPALSLGFSGLTAASPWLTLPVLEAGRLWSGSLFRVTFSQPTREEVTIVATATGPNNLAAGDQKLELPQIVGGKSEEPRIILAPGIADRHEIRVENRGSESPFAVRLCARGSTQPAPKSERRWRLDSPQLMIYLESDGRPKCILSGRIIDAVSGSFQVSLPPEAEVFGASVVGRLIDPPQVVERTANRLTLSVPLPSSGSSGAPFEIVYRLPRSNSGFLFWERHTVVPPVLPGHSETIPCRWSIAPEFRFWPVLDESVGAGASQEIVTIQTSSLSGLSYALAALIGGIVVSLSRNVDRRIPWVLFSACVGLLAIFFWILPESWGILIQPSLVVGLMGFSGIILFANLMPGGPSQTNQLVTPTHLQPLRLSSTVSYGPVIVMVAFLAASTTAQAPEPATVYVLNGHTGVRGELDVLVPESVLSRLASLATPLPPAVVITSAEYAGKDTGEGAHFTARYQLLCTRDGEQVFQLPLGSVRLESIELDGKPAFPDGTKPDQYGLTIPGRGRHELVARFAVASSSTGMEHEIRFSLPEVPESKVRFVAPPGSRQVDIKTRRGFQTITSVDSRIQVEAEHGGGRSLAIFWRHGSADQTTTMTVREVCMWDVSSGHDSAIMAFLCRVEAGTLSRIGLELPDDLEPGRFGVKLGDGRLGGAALKDWRIGLPTNGWRKLELEFQTPVEGRFVLVVHLAPRWSGSKQPRLRIPRMLGASRVEGYYGLRLNGIAVAELPRVGVIDYPADALVKEFSGLPELGLDRLPTDRAFQRIVPGPEPELRPLLMPLLERPTGAADVVWTAGSRLMVEGSVRITIPTSTAVTEFDLPAVQLDEVRAPELSSWMRVGSRVQIWLKKPTRDLTVRWSGFLLNSPTKTAKAELPAIELPIPTLPSGSGQVTVRVRPVEGWVALPQPVPGVRWHSIGKHPTAEQVAESEIVAPRIRLFPPQPLRGMIVRESAELEGNLLQYLATLTIPCEPSRPEHFAMTLAGVAEGTPVELRGPAEVGISPSGAGSDGPRWSIIVPTTFNGPLILTASARLPLGRLPQPQLTFGGPPVGRTDGAVLRLGSGLAIEDGPTGWRQATQEESLAILKEMPIRTPTAESSLWLAREALVPWILKSALQEKRNPIPQEENNRSVSSSDSPVSETIESFPELRKGAKALGWLTSFGALAVLAGRCRRFLWPERLTACGLLGASLLGFESAAGIAFALAAASGVMVRVILSIRYVMR